MRSCLGGVFGRNRETLFRDNYNYPPNHAPTVSPVGRCGKRDTRHTYNGRSASSGIALFHRRRSYHQRTVVGHKFTPFSPVPNSDRRRCLFRYYQSRSWLTCGTSNAVNNKGRWNIYVQDPPCYTQGAARIGTEISGVCGGRFGPLSCVLIYRLARGSIIWRHFAVNYRVSREESSLNPLPYTGPTNLQMNPYWMQRHTSDLRFE